MYRFHVYNTRGELCDVLDKDFGDGVASYTNAKARKYARNLVEANALVGVDRVEAFFIPLKFPKVGGGIGYDYENLKPVMARGVPYVARVACPVCKDTACETKSAECGR